MQLHLERPGHAYVLRAADGHSALVNARRLGASFFLAPDHLDTHWPVTDATRLSAADLAPLLALDPELIVLGTGQVQRFPPPDAQAACLARGIGLEAMTNAAAARTFNVLAAEGRRVVAGFVLPG